MFPEVVEDKTPITKTRVKNIVLDIFLFIIKLNRKSKHLYFWLNLEKKFDFNPYLKKIIQGGLIFCDLKDKTEYFLNQEGVSKFDPILKIYVSLWIWY